MKLLGASLLFAALVLPSPASAGVILTSILTADGGNPNASGVAVLNLDGVQGDFQLTYNLSAPIIVGSGIYDETQTVLLYQLTIPSGAGASGFLQQTFTFSPTEAATLLAGELYVGIFSQAFPSGPPELGGELQAVPEPASIALLGLGLAGLVWRRHRIRSVPSVL